MKTSVDENRIQVDAGLQEKILLSSRDQASLLIAGYDDIKRCINEAFEEVRSAARLAADRRQSEAQRQLEEEIQQKYAEEQEQEWNNQRALSRMENELAEQPVSNALNASLNPNASTFSWDASGSM